MALAELYHLIEKENRAQTSARFFFSEPNARCKMPLLFYLPLIIWTGLLDVTQSEMRPLSKSRRDGRFDDDSTR